jgi:hypothetical protein
MVQPRPYRARYGQNSLILTIAGNALYSKGPGSRQTYSCRYAVKNHGGIRIFDQPHAETGDVSRRCRHDLGRVKIVKRCAVFACPARLEGPHSWYDNYDATRWVVWLVGLVRERRDLSRVLRIGVCRSKQQQRIRAKKGAIGAEIRAQGVLRPHLLFLHTAAVQQDLRCGTDDRLPTGNNQALTLR